jgi:ribonuclease T2
MGTAGLAWHQWKKHGRCSGLPAGDYFDTARLAYTVLSLPEPRDGSTAAEIERDLIALNPGLDGDEVIVTCRSGAVQEVRICLTTDLEPRACSRDVLDDACRSRGPLDVPDPP